MSELLVLRDEVRSSLNDAQFQVLEETNPKEDMSFDIIAQYNSRQLGLPNLVIKILQNIDNIKPYFINELKLISHLVAALPVFIAQENRHSALQSDSIYLRRNIFAVNLPTFQKIIRNPKTALALCYAKQGGFFHEVDGEKMMELRQKHGFSRKILAQKMDISAKAISQYERSGMRASIENSKLLQDILGESIIKKFHFFKVLHASVQEINLDPKLQLRIAASRKEFMQTINEIIDRTGYHCFWPKNSPFDLCVYQIDDKNEKISEISLVGGTNCELFPTKIDQTKKAEFLKQVPQDSAIIYDEDKLDQKQARLKEIPYLVPKELKKLENPKEFKKLIQKRRVNN